MDLPNNDIFKAILFKIVIKSSGDMWKSVFIIFQVRESWKWFQAQEIINPIQSNLVKCNSLLHTQPDGIEQRQMQITDIQNADPPERQW